MPTFDGVIPPLVTPLTPGGELDLESLDRLVDQQLEAGVHGLFVLGSSGQVAYLTDAQRVAVIRRVVDRARGRVPVLAGAADLTGARVIDQGRQAAEAGVDAIVMTAPFYALNDAREVADHFRMVHAATGLPIMAYDVPVRVHSKLSAALLLELGSQGVIVGVKDSSGNDVAFRMLVADNDAAGKPLSLLSGHEVMCDGMYLLGADGVVPGLANVDPAGYVRLHEAARSGDWEGCRREQDRLAQLFRIAFVPQGRSGDAAGIGAFKQAMASLGMIASATMPAPLQGLTEKDAAAIDEILAEVGLK